MKKSGEGTIYLTNKPGFLAKIYHSISQEQIDKLQVMVKYPPQDTTLTRNHTSIAWPRDLLKNQQDKYLGFLMPEIKGGQILINVFNPKLRKKQAPGFNWLYLHTTALNIAIIVRDLHTRNYVIGDLKPDNFLVNNRGLVSIIDTDSLQIKDPDSKKVYRCNVASEQYTPPELLGKDLQTVDRSEAQDCFALAVVIWNLLFGDHPFDGKWLGVEEQPDINERIRQGWWLYGLESKIGHRNSSMPLEIIHPTLQNCFRRCFDNGHKDPYARPHAAEWIKALETARHQLVPCSINGWHYYTSNYGRCYWCERKQKLNIDIFDFPGVAPPPPPLPAPTPVITEQKRENISETYPSSEPINRSVSPITRLTKVSLFLMSAIIVFFIGISLGLQLYSVFSPFQQESQTSGSSN